MPPTSPSRFGNRQPHPLAVALIERLAPQRDVRVLELGTGSGRNTAALLAAGFAVTSVDDDPRRTQSVTEHLAHERLVARTAGYGEIAAAPQRYDAALSTHAFLHGTPRSIAQTLFALSSALRRGAPLYATFASVHDARYGVGEQVDDDTFAPASGDERGVAHVYFSVRTLREALEPLFAIESLAEERVDEIAGRWAHRTAPLRGAVHWFVRATLR